MGERPLYTLQLRMLPRRPRVMLHGLDCVIGGVLGALGAVLVIWWLA